MRQSIFHQQEYIAETLILRSDLCDYRDAYIVAKGVITVYGTAEVNKRNKKLALRNSAAFRSGISKINNTFIRNAEDLGFVIPMYNLSEYIDNYSTKAGSLWNYYRDEINYDANEIVANRRMNNNKTTLSKFFSYKTKIIGRTPADNNTTDTEVVVPLKYFSNF